VLPQEAECVVRALIQGGESYYVEFKTAWEYGRGPKARNPKDVARDIGEACVAFANSDGGDLLVGVEDTGRVTGLPYEQDALDSLGQAPRLQVPKADLGVQVRNVRIDGLTVLWFRVPESGGTVAVTASGRCRWRRHAITEPVPPTEIQRRRDHRLGDTAYESTPVPNANIDDLEMKGPLQAIAALGHLSGFVEKRDVQGLLRYWNLLETRNGTVVLRRAALLLFGREALRWHANNRIRIRRVHGSAEGTGPHLHTLETEILGPIAKLLGETKLHLLREHQVEARQGSLFVTTQLLPATAVEECFVNAVAHRNYAVEGAAIEVLLFPDRVEFRSPGRLPEPLTLQDLRRQRGLHRSRNPLIMRVLRDLGWVRDQGEGMRRIFGAMSQVELHEPELEEEADTFIVRLSTRSIHDEETQAWLAAYGPYGLEPHERKYVLALRQAAGPLSVDRLARKVGEPFDRTREILDALEAKAIVWHKPKSRKFHLVAPLMVLHEKAYRALKLVTGPNYKPEAGIEEGKRAEQAIPPEWKELGIVVPTDEGWKPGPGFIEYVTKRDRP